MIRRTGSEHYLSSLVDISVSATNHSCRHHSFSAFRCWFSYRSFALIAPEKGGGSVPFTSKIWQFNIARAPNSRAAITYTVQSGLEFLDSFLRSVLLLSHEEHETRTSSYLLEIHWDHFHPHRTPPVSSCTPSLEILREAFEWLSGILGPISHRPFSPSD